MIKMGIVGTGETIGIAKLHIMAYKRIKEVEITAIYDILPDQGDKTIKAMGLESAKNCTSYEELLSCVDAVTICTPNSEHIDMTVQALKAGKHVLCEKPMATDAKSCLPALKYEELSQKVCMIGLCYRHVPGYMYIKKMIDEGFLGDVYYARLTLGGGRIANPDVKLEWRMQECLSGPGAMADFGSHMLDISEMLLKDTCGKLNKVHCISNTFIENRTKIGDTEQGPVTNDDVAVFNAQFESGALVSYVASRIGCTHTLEIFGSKGYITFDGRTPMTVKSASAQSMNSFNPTLEEHQVPEEMYMIGDNPTNQGFEVNFYLQALAFVDAIKNGKKGAPGFARGYYVQQLIDALDVSAKTGQQVSIDF